MPSKSRRPKAFETILLGGLIAGVLDGLDAAIYYDLVSGVAPGRIFQHIASGLLGAKSFNGGLYTIVLGVLLRISRLPSEQQRFFMARALRSRPYRANPG